MDESRGERGKIPPSMPDSAPGSLQLGSTFVERYLIESVLGRGAFGTTYRALDKSSGSQIVLKVLEANDEEAEAMLLAERRASASLSGHPNIVTMLDEGVSGPLCYMVFES